MALLDSHNYVEIVVACGNGWQEINARLGERRVSLSAGQEEE